VLSRDSADKSQPASTRRALVRSGSRSNAVVAGAVGVQDQAGLDLSAGNTASAQFGLGAAAPLADAAAAPAPQIARNAAVEVRVDRGQFAARWREANEVAARHGGFVVDSSAETVRGQLARGNLTARVPAANLDAVVRDLRRLGTPVRVSDAGRDVGPQLVDYDARLRNSQAREAQLLDLLRGTRSAAAVAEVRSQLDQARGEIEGLQAERARLQAQVDFATVQATVTEPLGAVSAEPHGSFAKALHRAGDGIVAVLTGLVVAAGYAAPIALLVAIGWQTRRRWRRRALER
jgi:hypothetical protein